LKQEDHEFEASLGYIREILSSKINKKKPTRKQTLPVIHGTEGDKE
jgi:hypothetical protein